LSLNHKKETENCF